MARVLAAASGLLLVLVTGVSYAEPLLPASREIDSVRLIPGAGTTFEIAGRRYLGEIELRPGGQGVVVVERVGLDDYLVGVREVPFSWPEAALEAQAVAARTYLAWTLQRGRAGAGRTYGFDICATTACQVYAGSVPRASADLERWRIAIELTGNQILEYRGAPAQTLYSSSAGRRTRANQDIFSSQPLPYLQPVDSPEAGVTPYESWTVEAPAEAVLRVLGAGGYDAGDDLRDVWVDRPPDGGGPSYLRLLTSDGVTSVPVTTVRWVMSDHGPELYPGLFPGRRPSGGRWPQAILSYSFDATYVPPVGPVLRPGLAARLPGDERTAGTVRFAGEGWGHGVGMSQWGAKAMADAGASYQAILGHYYTGLSPTDGAEYLPDMVSVGLGWTEGEVAIEAGGAFELVVNGVPVGTFGGGTWNVRRAPGGLSVVPPIDLVDPPTFARPWPR